MSDEVATSIFFSIVVASAFPTGALIAAYLDYSSRIRANLASFGAGIFFATMAYSLIDESLKIGTTWDMIIGFVLGAVTFSVVNYALVRRHNNAENAGRNEPSDKADELAKKRNFVRPRPAATVIMGTFADSIPETLFIGIILGMHLHGLIPAVIALFLGNLAATLEGAKRMREAGKPSSRIIYKWLHVFGLVSIAGPIGYFTVQVLTRPELSVILGFAAGALMAFISEELIPQAHEKAEVHIGLSATFGFLVGFGIFHFLS